VTNTHTKISWTEATWNPATGCQPVSPGCNNCYARIMTEQFRGAGSFDKVELHPERLADPLRWRKAKKVFVNSMGELFHADVPDEFVAAVWTTMYWTSRLARTTKPRQTYQILTKRHARMRAWVRKWGDRDQRVAWIETAVQRGWCDREDRTEAPFMPPVLPNVLLGVSTEDQEHADLRIPALLETPAAVRFLSCEPLLGPVDLRVHLNGHCAEHDFLGGFCVQRHHPGVQHLHWVIAGGESGKNARPMRPDWARALRDQCAADGVPFFFKQAGASLGREWGCSDSKGTDMTAWPEDLQVQAFPAVNP
jgi:protein gp37